ncbi:MAG: hypothetical protein U0Z70_20350 [Thermomicrobiales bacterium]
MDGSTFDKLSQLVSRAGTRRSALSTLAAAGLGGAALLAASDAEGKGKGKKKRKRKCKNVGRKACTSDKQCCPGKTKFLCRVPNDGSNSDTFCCGGTGAKCSRNNEGDIGDEIPPTCCTDFTCDAAPGSTGTCQPNPPEI